MLALAFPADVIGWDDAPRVRNAPAASRVSVDSLPLLPAPAPETPARPVGSSEAPALGPRIDTSFVNDPARLRDGKSAAVAAAAEADEPASAEDLPADIDALRAETREWLGRIDEMAARAEPSSPGDAGVSKPDQVKKMVTSGLDAGGKGRSGKGKKPAPSAAGATGKTSAPPAGAIVGAKPLRDVLAERQLLLDEYDRASKELATLTGAGPDPAEMAAAARAELERLQPQVSGNAPFHLPPLFDIPATAVTAAALGEMKEAIERAKNDLRSWQARLEAAHAESAKTGTKATGLRTERDKLFRSVAALKAKGQERETAVTSARTAEERQLARERLTNVKLEARVEDLRLKVMDATQGREGGLVEVRQLNERVVESQVQLSRKLLAQMQGRYQAVAESQERELKRAAVSEENKARQSDDPLERYRARRLSELLELEALVLKNEQSLATGTRPSLEEERALADRAESEFAQIKQLLDDGNVSRLDALRLNNDFRRIGPERDGLLRNELTSIETQLQFYENVLTNVELELIEDSLADQAEHDALLERLAAERHAQARIHFAELEKRHRTLLERRRAALTKLVARASETLSQVTRRLRSLEEEYGFIRTHLFWVRDQEPIGAASVTQVANELRRLALGMAKLAREVLDPRAWGQPSTEFLGATAAAIVLPLGLFRLRRLLRRRITRALPPSHLHGDQPGGILVDMSGAGKRA